MNIQLTGILIIVGNYGSGKTEVSINLAVERKRAGLDVRVADLDLVNPYFRTREARTLLKDRGIELVLPPEQYMHADLPILSPAIAGMLRRPAEVTLLDVGGDDVGATVLAALADALQHQEIHMLQVVNPFRPFTETVEGCLKIRQEIEAAAKLKINGFIGNPNLIDETGPEDIYRGYDFIRNLSQKAGLPLEFLTVETGLLPEIDASRFSCPLLPIDRQLVPPWKKAGGGGPTGPTLRP
ncbi:MAG: cobalamin biosynthesis protein CbiA [Thermodesulfobacteriota bacterium]